MAKELDLPEGCRAILEAHLDADLFRALCDPTRLALLARLCMASTSMTVTEAAQGTGVHLSCVSRHLSKLGDAHVVQAEKRGREVSYRLDYGRLIGALRGLADAIETCRTEETKEGAAA